MIDLNNILRPATIEIANAINNSILPELNLINNQATVTFTNGVNYSDSDPIRLLKYGHVVWLQGSAKSTQEATSVNLFTLPIGYRPLYEVRTIEQGSGQNRFLLRIKTNGVVTAERYGIAQTSAQTINTNSWLSCNSIFLTG